MAMLYDNFPFGTKPCKRGDYIRLRDEVYQITGAEPFTYVHSTMAINGITERIGSIVPRNNIIHYVQYMTSSNPAVEFSIERPEGQLHVTVDQVRQFLNSVFFSPNSPLCLKYSILNGESLALRYQVTANQIVSFHFFGWKLYVIKTSYAGEDIIDLDDLVEFQKK